MSTSNELKSVSWKDFEELGFIQEINRRLLHPCGYEMRYHKDGFIEQMVIYEYSSPGGAYYNEDSLSRVKAQAVVDKFNEHLFFRREKYGHIIQPVPEKELPDG